MIDNQVASSPTAGEENVPLNYVAETTAFGGSALAKHITSVSSISRTCGWTKSYCWCVKTNKVQTLTYTLELQTMVKIYLRKLGHFRHKSNLSLLTIETSVSIVILIGGQVVMLLSSPSINIRL